LGMLNVTVFDRPGKASWSLSTNSIRPLCGPRGNPPSTAAAMACRCDGDVTVIKDARFRA